MEWMDETTKRRVHRGDGTGWESATVLRRWLVFLSGPDGRQAQQGVSCHGLMVCSLVMATRACRRAAPAPHFLLGLVKGKAYGTGTGRYRYRGTRIARTSLYPRSQGLPREAVWGRRHIAEKIIWHYYKLLGGAGKREADQRK